MYQAHAHELLNQKEDVQADSGPLAEATERLRDALDRLENRVYEALNRQNAAEKGDEAVYFERENEALRAERDSLNLTIHELQSQYGELHRAASTIYNKLGDSIKRLTQIIGD